jgi:hypothetical protein
LRKASLPVAQKFSTWVTGLCWIFNGRLSVRPDSPDPIVPNQKASMSSSVTPALASAADDASMSMSSALLSQCSPKLGQPIPMIATLSRDPV